MFKKVALAMTLIFTGALFVGQTAEATNGQRVVVQRVVQPQKQQRVVVQRVVRQPVVQRVVAQPIITQRIVNRRVPFQGLRNVVRGAVGAPLIAGEQVIVQDQAVQLQRVIVPQRQFIRRGFGRQLILIR